MTHIMHTVETTPPNATDAYNPFRRAKYWRKAMRAAGIIK